MKNYPKMLIEATIDTFNIWAGTPVGELPDDPVELCLMGAASPVRLFVKNEPHSADKIKTGKSRLIAMVPFHIVLTEMLGFSIQNNEEINHWSEVPSKPGIGLADDSHIEKMWESVVGELNNGKCAEADVSGYDWSLTDVMFRYDALRRCLLAGVTSGPFWNFVHNAHHVLCRRVFVLSDGRMYKQLTPGVMKSGRYVTSSTNSFIRVLLSRSIGSSWCYAMGDDSLEEYVEGAIEKYKKLGVKVKFYVKSQGQFEFCSHTFVGGRVAFPSKPGKMLYNLLSTRQQDDVRFRLFQQWAFEMRHHPEYDAWVTAIERSGWSVQINGC